VLQSMRAHAKWIWLIFIIPAFIIGFNFFGQSGLSSNTRLTRGTAVGSVNGQEINYDMWLRAYNGRLQSEQQQRGKALTLDDERQLSDQTFNDLTSQMLLDQEYKKRSITVNDEELRQEAQNNPPPEFARNPEFQTEGQFDLEKYRRFLNSPVAKQQGILYGLEQYYRSEIPKRKLLQSIAAGSYVTDAQLWRIYQDAHDSVQASYVALRPETVPDSTIRISDAEIKTYFDQHAKDFADRPGRAVVSVTTIPRIVTPADSAAVRAHAIALRNEILGGAKFEDVAKRESADSVSAAQGGSLGKGPRGRFVPAFENAAFALKPGEISQPVLSPFGYHLIKVDERKGDTISVRHILLRIQQSDSAADIVARRADTLSSLAAGSEDGSKFDAAVKRLGLQSARLTTIEGEPLTWNGRYVPGVSAWAFGGLKPGEVSDLLEGDDGYYLARLDSITAGGKPTLVTARDEIRRELIRQKKVDALMPKAERIAAAVKSGKSLEEAAKEAGATVEKTPSFTRAMPVPGLGQLNEAIGTAFGLPAGQTSGAIKTNTGVFVIRTDRRVAADKAAWTAQKTAQRQQYEDRLRQARVQEFLVGLRQQAKIVDNRKEILRAQRNTAT